MHTNASEISYCTVADLIYFRLYIILISVIEGEIDTNLIEAIQWQTSWKEYIQYIIQTYIHNNIMDIPHNALWCIRHEVCHCIASIRFVSISPSITDIRMMYNLK
jgi:hypothetical protein